MTDPKALDSFWQEQYDEAASGSANNFLFFKAEKTRLRLLGKGDDPREWVRKVESQFRNNKLAKYLVLAYEITSPDQTEFLLQAAVFSKGAWANVASLAREGHDFFSPDGVGISVVRQNNSGRTSYQVIPAPRAIEIPEAMLEAVKEANLDFYVAEFNKMQENRNNNEGNSNVPSGNATSVADAIVNAPNGPNEW